MRLKKSHIILIVILFLCSCTKKDKHIESIEGKEIPVLIYHNISEDVENKNIVSPKKFEDDVETLKKNGYEGILLQDLYNYVENKKKLPKKPILITFDDGYVSNYNEGYKIAKKLNFKMNIGIIGWSVGEKQRVSIEHFNWNEAKEMERSGLIEINSHTYDLHSPKGNSYGFLEECGLGVGYKAEETKENYKKRMVIDIERFEEGMISNLGHRSRFMVYPYGVFNEDIEKIIKENGYVGSLTTEEGIRAFKDNNSLYRIPRLNVDESMRGKELIERIKNLELVN